MAHGKAGGADKKRKKGGGSHSKSAERSDEVSPTGSKASPGVRFARDSSNERALRALVDPSVSRAMASPRDGAIMRTSMISGARGAASKRPGGDFGGRGGRVGLSGSRDRFPQQNSF